MEENRQKNSRKRLNSLILLVAFTAIMLIVSTYAWFSAQKNVSISNLEGIVKVVEGLEISLDAARWSQSVDIGAAMANAATSGYFDTGYNLATPYQNGKNILPSEMIPVSTTGAEDIGTKTGLTMYRGTNVNGVDLYGITDIIETRDGDITDPTNSKFPGYYAIDLFLKNTTSGSQTTDQLQLNINSELKLKSGGSTETGLQNTVRVAFALYTAAEGNEANVNVTNPNQSSIIAELVTGKNINDVAIWEPNADAHIGDIVLNNNRITWSTTDAQALWGDDTETAHKFTTTDAIPTYALTSTSKDSTETVKVDQTTSTGIANIYDWSATSTTGLTKQVVVPTNVTRDVDEDSNPIITGGALTAITDLKSVSGANFVIPANQVCRIRMYVWLEGQDVDCTNVASHGGGIKLDLGLVKPGSDVS